MRVLVVTSEWPSVRHPSSGASVVRQVDWIRRAGHLVDVESFRSATNPFNYVSVRRRVRRRIRQKGYDILHAHFGQAAIAVIGSRLPIVATFHGSDLTGLVGTRGSYTVKGRLLTTLSRVAARFADEVIVMSESLGRRLPGGVRYSVVPTAVDPEIFAAGSKDDARRALGLPAQRKLVLFAGRADASVKRYELARRAVDDVAESFPVDLLTISGEPPTTVATFLQACDALLLTSRHEGSPAIIREALSCRLPIVSVDVGDVRATIGGVSGCVVVSDDSSESLSLALRTVLSGPGFLEISELPSGLHQAEQAARIVEIYERLLGRGSSRGALAR